MPEAIHVNIPTPLPPARRSILRSQSMSDVSIASSESKASSITFAPLPAIESRKRRNGRAIGLATRAEMLRRTPRRHFTSQFTTYEEQQYKQYIPPDDDDIPLPDLGKLVKGLWKSVSRKEKNRCEPSLTPNTASITNGINTAATEGEDEEGGVWMEEVTWTPTSEARPPLPLREDHPKKEIRQDTHPTAECRTFLDGLEGMQDIQTRLEFNAREERKEIGSYDNLKRLETIATT